jgi:hypothetical protein
VSLKPSDLEIAGIRGDSAAFSNAGQYCTKYGYPSKHMYQIRGFVKTWFEFVIFKAKKQSKPPTFQG